MRRGFIATVGALLAGCGIPMPVKDWDGDGSKKYPFTNKLAHGPLDDMNSRILYARQKVGTYLRLSFPGYGTCGRCKWPWAVIDGHSTQFTNGEGCFPLCEQGGKELKIPENRIPYYDALV